MRLDLIDRVLGQILVDLGDDLAFDVDSAADRA